MKSLTDAAPKVASRSAKYVVWIVLIAIVLLGIACLIASWIPYSSIYAVLQRQYGAVLIARRLTREFYEQKQHLLRILGCVALVLGGVLFWWRRSLAEMLMAQLSYVRRGWHRSVTRLRFATRHAEASEIFDILAVTAVGLVDRIIFLAQPARFDEAVSYLDYASKPLYLLLSVYTEPENHIFNTLLVHFSTGIFGGRLWAIRLPALCAGILMVPLAYLVGRQLYGRAAAVVGASLVATSSSLLEYSTNGRGYMIVGCCFLLLLLCGALALRKTDPVLFLVVAVATAIGFYAIPIMLFPAGCVLLWIALSVWKRPRKYLRTFWKLALATIVLAGLLTVIFYSPVFVVSGVKAVTANPYVKKIDFASFVTKNETYFRDAWHLWHQDFGSGGTLLAATGFVLSIVLSIRKLNPQRRLIGAILLWCVFALVFFRFAPFPRVWLFLVPIYLLSAATGWVYLGEWVKGDWPAWQQVWRIVAFALLAVLSLRDVHRRTSLDSGETGGCPNAEQAVDFLIQNHIPLQQLIRPAVCNMQMIYYYLPRSGKSLQEIRFLPTLDEKPSANSAPGAATAEPRTHWVFVNWSEGDTLATVLHRENLDGVKVLQKVEFDKGYLAHIELEP
jgi:Dolichyl-phosphate-mannose-protein mannosyltransferase